jgi:hypothetical protein
MPPKFTAVQLERLGQLLGTPQAVEVLEALGRHVDAVAVSQLPGPADVTRRAVAFLCEFGAATTEASEPDPRVSLTPRGHRLVEALRSEPDS